MVSSPEGGFMFWFFFLFRVFHHPLEGWFYFMKLKTHVTQLGAWHEVLRPKLNIQNPVG